MSHADPEDQRRYGRDRARKRRLAGVCAQCNAPVKPGFGRCPKHLSANPKMRMAKRRELGIE